MHQRAMIDYSTEGEHATLRHRPLDQRLPLTIADSCSQSSRTRTRNDEGPSIRLTAKHQHTAYSQTIQEGL
jgi:hypothetical protein